MTSRDPLAERYVAQRPNSAALHARAREFFPANGATHFARVKAPFRPYISHSAGAAKWDVDGHRYVDFVMGHGALVLGHGHPAVVAAMSQQAGRGIHFGDNHALEVEWASLIRELMPRAERIEFTASGQEANHLGLRVARAFTGRRRLLRFAHNYHGWGDELCAPGSAGSPSDNVTVIPANDIGLVERTLASGAYALVLIEGGGGRLSGRVPTDPGFFRQLPEVGARFGTLVMLDEVVTGFREAPGGWQSVVGMTPDLASIGKAASGGVSSGALIGRADVMAGLGVEVPVERRVMHGGTWNAGPLACAAGIAACGEYRGGAPQRQMAASAERLLANVNGQLRQAGLPARLYGRSVLHVYLGAAEREDDRLPPVAAVEQLMDATRTPLYQRLDLQLLTRGIATLRGEGLALSAAHTDADLDLAAEAVVASVAAMVAEGTL
ncbi:MAG: aminotransferase class III-fold pyridoxal phosphate-dependent enzyme [Gemmatimonadales bacterium]